MIEEKILEDFVRNPEVLRERKERVERQKQKNRIQKQESKTSKNRRPVVKQEEQPKPQSQNYMLPRDTVTSNVENTKEEVTETEQSYTEFTPTRPVEERKSEISEEYSEFTVTDGPAEVSP